MRLIFLLLLAVPSWAAPPCTNCTNATNCQNCTNPSCAAVKACLGPGVSTTLTPTTTVPASTVPATAGVQLSPDGALRVGQCAVDLLSWRQHSVRMNEYACGRNGDCYVAAGPCVTGAARPAGLPYMVGDDARGKEVPIAAGSVVYPGWAGWDAWGFTYTASASCQTGAMRPTWCTTAGCQVTSGSCTLTARAVTPQQTTFTDGTCQWKQWFTDIGCGGYEGPTAAAEMGLPFPRSGNESHFGDNPQHDPYEGGRGDYGGVDEVHFAAGAWADDRRMTPGDTLKTGAAVLAGPTLGIATSPPLVLTALGGTIPVNVAPCLAIAWENSLGGPTRVGTLRCFVQTTGGVRVAMPERDEWHWPIAFPSGKTLGRVYATMLPSPCTPNPGQTICTPSLPRQVSLNFLDYLYTPTDTLEVTTMSAIQETDGPPVQNTSGLAISPVRTYDPNLGVGPCGGFLGQTGGAGAPCVGPNGWNYSIYGTHCQIAADGCRRCNRQRGAASSVPISALPSWRTDRVPFGNVGDPSGVCWQWSGSLNEVGTEFQANGYADRGSNGCTWVATEPFFASDGTEQKRLRMGLCQGELRWFGPGGITDVVRRCNAAGCS